MPLELGHMNGQQQAKLSEFLCQHGVSHGHNGTPLVDDADSNGQNNLLKFRKAPGHDGIQNENIV